MGAEANYSHFSSRLNGVHRRPYSILTHFPMTTGSKPTHGTRFSLPEIVVTGHSKAATIRRHAHSSLGLCVCTSCAFSLTRRRRRHRWRHCVALHDCTEMLHRHIVANLSRLIGTFHSSMRNRLQRRTFWVGRWGVSRITSSVTVPLQFISSWCKLWVWSRWLLS